MFGGNSPAAKPPIVRRSSGYPGLQWTFFLMILITLRPLRVVVVMLPNRGGQGQDAISARMARGGSYPAGGAHAPAGGESPRHAPALQATKPPTPPGPPPPLLPLRTAGPPPATRHHSCPGSSAP